MTDLSDSWLFTGLGNPGLEYAGNRHNIGFMVIDVLAAVASFPAFRSKFDGLVSEGRLAGRKVVLLKPQTYVNESGVSVGKAARFYKIPPERIVVFYDELDLPPGKVRVKQGGGTGGHNGLKSLDAHLENKEYWRVRMGIGHPGDRERVTGYVLGDFSKEEREWLPDWVAAVAGHADLLAAGNVADFMTRVAENGPLSRKRANRKQEG